MLCFGDDLITGNLRMVGQISKYTLEYLYGQYGITAIVLDGRKYYYRRNIQGDITKIFSIDGRIQACYTYDAWGNHTITDETGIVIYDSKNGITAGYENHIGHINPIRYRGYYYDAETGLYLLKSRYYDPEVGRFINMDDPQMLHSENMIIGGVNLYQYAYSNPVMYRDDNGHGFFTTLLIVTLVGALIGGATKGVSAVNGGAELWSKEFWGAVGAGALTGGALGFAFALGGGAGAIATGKMTALFGLGKAASISLMLGTTVGVNFVAGKGGYAIEANTNPNMTFNAGQMFMAGVGQAGKAVVNFGLGGIMGGARFWKLGNMQTARVLGIQGTLTRTVAKNVLAFLPFSILDGLFSSF